MAVSKTRAGTGCLACVVGAHTCGCCGSVVGHSAAICTKCANVFYRIISKSDRRSLR